MTAQAALRLAPAGSCRFCGAALSESVVDLGRSPPANAYLAAEELGRPEPTYPLHAYVCGSCLLVQLQDFQSPDELFQDYAYFSSYSDTWMKHVERYCDDMIQRFDLRPEHRVIEVASNDGYLLQFFSERGIPVMGVEPAGNVAHEAMAKGIPTIVRFFGVDTARGLVAQGHQADLLIGNNVLAHVPNLKDFVGGLKIVLRSTGVLTMEFPHLLRLLAETQFDTIYHEHFSYFSLMAVQRIFEHHHLKLFDVEELPTHGGSLRVFACHDADPRPVAGGVEAVLAAERAAGLDRLDTYRGFGASVRTTRRMLRDFLTGAKLAQRSVVGYGAPAKGNTLLNYCGVGADLIGYTVDRSPHKQGKFLPGTHIPIHHPDHIRETKPDFVLILPWNLKREVMEQMSFIRDWGGRFVVPIPQVRVYD
jgi:C-methyltransferase C-terminal domain/Putative zinc binding domain/Methyltransferase domain